MAKRYFNVFKSHVFALIVLVILVCISEIAYGTTLATVAQISAGVLMIYAAIRYTIWLFKKPTVSINEEMS
jgi:hypothetical protein